jgi:hypothetical protein
MEELTDWPVHIVKAICADEEMALRLRTALLGGVTLYIDYSVMDCLGRVWNLASWQLRRCMAFSFLSPLCEWFALAITDRCRMPDMRSALQRCRSGSTWPAMTTPIF